LTRLLIINPEPVLTDEERRLIASPHLDRIPGTLAHGWALGCSRLAGDVVDVVTDRELRGLRMALGRSGLHPRPDPAIPGRWVIVGTIAPAINPLDAADPSAAGIGLPVRLSRLVPPGKAIVVDLAHLTDDERSGYLGAATVPVYPSGTIGYATLDRARFDLDALLAARYSLAAAQPATLIRAAGA
jgi:hypothetical protein